MKASPILLLVLAVIIIWGGINGNLGTMLASIFTPHQVKLLD